MQLHEFTKGFDDAEADKPPPPTEMERLMNAMFTHFGYDPQSHGPNTESLDDIAEFIRNWDPDANLTATEALAEAKQQEAEDSMADTAAHKAPSVPLVPYKAEPLPQKSEHTDWIKIDLPSGAEVFVGLAAGHPHGGIGLEHDLRNTQPDTGERTQLKFCLSPEAAQALATLYAVHGIVGETLASMRPASGVKHVRTVFLCPDCGAVCPISTAAAINADGNPMCRSCFEAYGNGG